MNADFRRAWAILSNASAKTYPRIVNGAVMLSREHLRTFVEVQWRTAVLVKRCSSCGIEVQDEIPLGKEYVVGPKAFWKPLGEECYYMADGGWFPAEMLELKDDRDTRNPD